MCSQSGYPVSRQEKVLPLSKALRQFQAGDVTTVTVYRGGKEIVLDITLDEKPAEVPETVPVTPQVPASIMQLHPDFTLVADEAALSLVGDLL